MSPDELVTTAQAASILGKSVPTIHRLADSGTLPVAHKLDGIRGAKLYRRADVEALLAPETAEAAS
jgi:excisionase family DNA binding protein